MLALAPGDPFSELATNPAIPPEVAASLRAKFGLDDPVWMRYLHWLTAMVQGDWGFSFASRIDVDTLILQRLPTTLIVIGAAQLLAIVVALPVGVLAARGPIRSSTRSPTRFAFIGFSLPTFFTGLLLILVFSVQLDWLPFVYRADLNATGWRGCGSRSSSRSCRSWCSACSRAARWCATCARPCSTWCGSTTSRRRAPRASASAR